jgi:hypothetical protein
VHRVNTPSSHFPSFPSPLTRERGIGPTPSTKKLVSCPRQVQGCLPEDKNEKIVMGILGAGIVLAFAVFETEMDGSPGTRESM